MSNSPLVNYTRISPNKTSPRNHKIDTITIHCYVGQASVEDMSGWFAKHEAQASCNYGIGADGRIALIVDEKDRSWCSSNKENDHRAITIECACDKTHPYTINSKVYKSLVNLCTDICKRNDIDALRWKNDKSLIGKPEKQNMTVHRWFKNKACPGDYIFNRLGQIAAEVNERLGSIENQNGVEITNEIPQASFSVHVIVDDLNYRSEPSMKGEIKGQTGKGVFTIVEVKNGWGKLKSGVGWIWLGNSDYCIVKNPVKETPFNAKVDTNELNIRTGPGTNYVKTGNKTGKGIFTIVDIKEGDGSDSGWGKLKSGAGWISLDFVKRV